MNPDQLDPAPTGDYNRDPNGRPRIPKPGGSGNAVYDRNSNFPDPNPETLNQRAYRHLTRGLITIFDNDAINPDDQHQIDRLIYDAFRISQIDLAADRGTHIHTLCEYTLNHLPIPKQLLEDGRDDLGIPIPLQHDIINKFVTMRAELGVTNLNAELKTVNDEHRTAGTIDCHDLITKTITTSHGTLYDGDIIVADIKTGAMKLGRNGLPKYAASYGPQLFYAATGQPFDVDKGERLEWPGTPPRQDIALIYHYHLNHALDGENVEWQVWPVDLHKAHFGAQAAHNLRTFHREAHNMYSTPLDIITNRRQQLLDRYHTLSDNDQARFRELAPPKDDLDAIQEALDQVDPFMQVTTNPNPRQRG